MDQLHPTVTADALSTIAPRSLFPSLETLRVFDIDVKCISLLLGAMSTSALQSLEVDVEPSVLPGAVASVAGIRALCESLSGQSSLQKLWFNANAFHGNGPQMLRSDYAIQDYTLEPLLSLHHLVEIALVNVDLALDLSDAGIEAMAKAWLRLQRFCILSDASVIDRPGLKLTLGGLLPFAEHCRQLEELQLPVDMLLPTEDQFRRSRELWHTHHSRVDLSLFHITYHCELDEVHIEEMAAFMSSLFSISSLHFECWPAASLQPIEMTDAIREQWDMFKQEVYNYTY